MQAGNASYADKFLMSIFNKRQPQNILSDLQNSNLLDMCIFVKWNLNLYQMVGSEVTSGVRCSLGLIYTRILYHVGRGMDQILIKYVHSTA